MKTCQFRMVHSQMSDTLGPKKDRERKNKERTYCVAVVVNLFSPVYSPKRSLLGPQDHGTSPLHQYQFSVEAIHRCGLLLISQSDADEVEVNARDGPRLLQDTPPI